MTNQITKKRVQNNHRASALAKAFPGAYMGVEGSAFNEAGRLSEDYNGGFWNFYRLDNGGFYMAPEGDSFKWANNMNFNSGEMTGDAFGIAVCLIVYSNLSGYYWERNDRRAALLGEQFQRLRAFALDHKEAAQIFSLID